MGNAIPTASKTLWLLLTCWVQQGRGRRGYNLPQPLEFDDVLEDEEEKEKHLEEGNSPSKVKTLMVCISLVLKSSALSMLHKQSSWFTAF